MFCEKCGAQIPDNAQFCEKCGNKVASAAAPAPAGQSVEKVQINLTKNQIIAIAAAALAIILGVILIANHKTTVNLDKYLKAEFEGYDTVGKARIYFDQEAFNEKYGGKFKRVTKSVIDDPAYIVASYMGSDIYKEKLSNGDTIDYIWDIKADKIEKELGCKLKYSDKTFTVEGLKEVETVDPFKYLTIEYSGISPKGKLEYKNDYGNDEAYGYLSISPDKSYDLSNGDEIVFTVSDLDYTNTRCAEEYGKIFNSETKTYTVEGLAHYADKISDLSDEAIEEMMKQAKDIMTAYIASSWSKEKLDSMEEAGVYVLKAKKPDSYNSLGISSVYVLLKINEYIGDDAASAPRKSYYFPVRYNEVLVDSDGKCVPDTGNYKTTYDRFDFEVQVGDHTERFYNYGYQTTDEFVEKCINVYADAYTYEKKDISANDKKTEEAKEPAEEAKESAEETTVEDVTAA